VLINLLITPDLNIDTIQKIDTSILYS